MEIEGGEKEILLAGEAIEVSYGKVDDVLVNGTSVVENKIADIKLKTINNQAVEGDGNIQIDGVTDYNQLNNRPQINGTTLSGNKTGGELGLQNYTDNDLATTSKTIVGAINEVDNLAKGANQALSFSNYEAMITEFNSAPVDKYKVGQNIYVLTLDVPDLWVSSVEDSPSTYTYSTDAAFISALNTNGYVQVGYYKLSALETQEVDLTDYVSKSGLLQTTGTATNNTMSQDAITTQLNNKANSSDVVTDVQINGTSIKSSGVANVPIATQNTPGAVQVDTGNGVGITSNTLYISRATTSLIDEKTNSYRPIVPSNLDYAVKVGVTTNTNTLTTSEKTNAQTWLGFVTLTQAQYDALVLAGTVDSGTYYHIIEE